MKSVAYARPHLAAELRNRGYREKRIQGILDLFMFITIYSTGTTGDDSYPGNRNMVAAIGLQSSALHENLKALEEDLNWIVNTNKNHVGRDQASVFRVLWENPLLPDYSPTGKECFTNAPGPALNKKLPENSGKTGSFVQPESIRKSPALPEALEKGSGLEQERFRLEPEKVPVSEKKLPENRGETGTHQPPPKPTPTIHPTRLDGWIEKNMAAMKGKPRGKIKNALDTLAGERGEEFAIAVLEEFVNRAETLNGVNQPWALFYAEKDRHISAALQKIQNEQEQKARTAIIEENIAKQKREDYQRMKTAPAPENFASAEEFFSSE